MSGFRGNLNYIARIVAGLLPSLYDFHLRDLGDEVRWFELRTARQGAYLKDGDRTKIAAIVARIPGIQADAMKARALRRQTGALREQLREDWDRDRRYRPEPAAANLPSWFELHWMKALEREYDRYIRDGEAEPAPLVAAVAEARHQIRTLDIEPDLAARLSGHVTAMSVEQETIESLKAKVAAYREAVRDAEIVLLERVRS